LHDTPTPPASLAALRAVIPAYCFQPHTALALRNLCVGLAGFGVTAAFGAWTFTQGLFWLWPLSWLLSGTAVISLFVLGHDCGHGSFLRSRPLMVILGHFLVLPAGYPFYVWKYSHDAHHAHTNQLLNGPGVYFDNAWIPQTVTEYAALRRRAPVEAALYRLMRWFPPAGSFLHLLFYSAAIGTFRPSHRRRIFGSYAFSLTVGGAIALALWSYGGPLALLHFWVAPALGSQLWMGLYTFVHHTAEDLPWFEPEAWRPGAVPLMTVNCRLPEAISQLHFRIDVHVPHHVSTAIPSYRLREANAALHHSAFGSQVREFPFRPAYLLHQVRRCHLWDPELQVYTTFGAVSRIAPDHQRSLEVPISSA
jgi:omega-6 fatty acid desaturase (delta-12 desaturase)